jgi:tRNA 2-thiocytidine biosynthesis protein TtcA
MRRGILNQWCADHGYNKLALGHHLDDAIETFLLNLFYGRRLDALKPATPASEVDVTTIRPMILVEERKIAAWSVTHEIPVVACPVCDTVPESRRRDLKEIIVKFQSLNADLHGSIRAALYERADSNTMGVES